MRGARIVLQARRGSGPWRTVAADRVRGGGHYEAAGPALAHGQSVTLRFAFLGGGAQRWLPAHSRAVRVVAE
jgi:hypothetical protein